MQEKHFWPLTLDQDQRSFYQMKAHCDFLYLYDTNMVSISHCFFKYLRKWHFDHWPWTKVKGHLPNESPCLMLYNYVSTTKESPSLIVFEILAKIAFITFHLGPRTNVISPNESPCMISYNVYNTKLSSNSRHFKRYLRTRRPRTCIANL